MWFINNPAIVFATGCETLFLIRCPSFFFLFWCIFSGFLIYLFNSKDLNYSFACLCCFLTDILTILFHKAKE